MSQVANDTQALSVSDRARENQDHFDQGPCKKEDYGFTSSHGSSLETFFRWSGQILRLGKERHKDSIQAMCQPMIKE